MNLNFDRMKKILSIAAVLLLSAVSSFAQRTLLIRDNSSDLAAFSGLSNEAGIVISCPGIIDLTFESTLEKVVDVYDMEVKGEEKFYYLRFKTYDNLTRKLTIRAEGFNPITINADLAPKALKRYQLIDPDADFVYGCYYEYRKRGNEFFEKSMYDEAKESYLVAKSSSDCPEDSNIDDLIAKIDSIAVYKKRAAKAFELLDYNTAINNYTSAIALNLNDMSLRSLRNKCFVAYRIELKQAYDMAEMYSMDGEYEKALELYEKVVNSKFSTPQIQDATEKAKRMRINIQNRIQHAKVFLYEFSVETPIGISYGTYRTRKAGRYFNFSFSPGALQLAQGLYDSCKHAEVNITPFGWNFNLVPSYPHFWLFFGLGYTGYGKFFQGDTPYISGTYKEKSATTVEPEEGELPEEMEILKPKAKLFHAVSPEIGVMGKVWRVSLRYTFQYRYGINQGAPENISKFRHVIGVGVNF